MWRQLPETTACFTGLAWIARVVIVTSVVIGIPPRAAFGQPVFQVLHTFAESAHDVVPRLVEGDDGGLYGPAQSGGAFGKGAILRFDRQPDGTLTSTTLHAFTGADGARPQVRLTLGTDGYLYGVALFGGATDSGTLFRVAPTGAFTVLHDFDAHPLTPLVQAADGNFYGLTEDGRLFRITPVGAFTIVAVLPTSPSSGLADMILGQDGLLYATMADSIFKITLAGDATQIAPIGGEPLSLIEASDGNFYGTAADTSTCCTGYVFRMTPAGAVTVLYVNSSPDGEPGTVVEGNDGLLYGTRRAAAASNRESVFRISRTGAMLETLHVFTGSEGQGPIGLMQARDGSFFGSTQGGGLTNRGLVYRLLADGTFTPLQYFFDLTPLEPVGHLTQGVDGYLYGTSCKGGLFNRGSVFRTSVTGDLTVLHSFFWLDGACPTGGLVQAGDGNFYGTTLWGGLLGNGSVFRIASNGTFSVLRWFAGADGSAPFAGLTIGSDGNLYGTTTRGGSTIFRITTSGVFTMLYSLHGTGTGDLLFGEVIEGPDGNLYGATLGNLFRLGPAGTFTIISQSNPLGSWGSLSRGSGGAMYGAGLGGVFRLTTAGDVTKFSFPISQAITNGPIQAVDGDFYGAGYGTCFFTCDANPSLGTLYSMTPDGVFAILHSFTGEDGAGPWGQLIQGSDGALYGTTVAGGPGGGGVVFRMTIR